MLGRGWLKRTMTPIVIVDVIPKKSKAARSTVEDFADDIERILPQPDGHVKDLVLGREVFHFMVEDRDKTVDTRLKLKNGALCVKRSDDPTAESVFCFVAFFEVAAPRGNLGIEALVEG
jgi:hypothetical protein